MPLVSIITPVYNAANSLPETLESVCAQTLTDWEQILVDDGSTDNSREIVEAAVAKDPRFRLLRTPRNGGPAEARNMALAAARGRYVAFLDADDLWMPEKLAHCVEWMTTKGYAFIYHDYRHMSHDGLHVGQVVHGPDTLTVKSQHTHRGTGCLTIVLDSAQIPEIRFPPVAPYHAEDFCLWAKLIQQGYIGHRFPSDLARYRLSPRGRSANKLESAIKMWHLYREISKISFARAVYWWVQYVWNAFKLHLNARPS
jgi:glycosyltransferase involved in cell wall biosynthesis